MRKLDRVGPVDKKTLHQLAPPLYPFFFLHVTWDTLHVIVPCDTCQVGGGEPSLKISAV